MADCKYFFCRYFSLIPVLYSSGPSDYILTVRDGSGLNDCILTVRDSSGLSDYILIERQ